jgi:SAM-dependent methyltransferase
MHAKKSRPLAQEAYDELAEDFAAMIDTKPHNAYYERPATLSLLPDVRGKSVLDAGCGPGVYSEWLAGHGADVVALDANEKMVRLARQRLGDSARVILADLDSAGISCRCSFDLISALVMDYIRVWDGTFSEFYRLLHPGCCLVFSIGHPFYNYDHFRQTSNYFDVELVEFTRRGFGKSVKMLSYRRPMSAVIDPLLKAGFVLEQILEPLPTEEFKQADPTIEDLIKALAFVPACHEEITPMIQIEHILASAD